MNKLSITKRQYEILRALEDATDWITLKELGKQCHCSYRTIHSELAVLKKMLPDGWSVITRRGSGLKMHRPVGETLANTFEHDENEQLFEMIHLLLTSRSYTLEEVCSKLYISPKSAGELLSKTEEFIRPFGLMLHQGPYRIIGNEGFKRLLLLEMRYTETEANGYYAIPPPEKKSREIQASLKKHGKLLLSNYGFNVFYEIFDICRQRSGQGYLPDELPFSKWTQIQDSPHYKGLAPFFDELEYLFQLDISPLDRIYLYLGIIFNEFRCTEQPDEIREKWLTPPAAPTGFRLFIDFLNTRLDLDVEHTFLIEIFNIYRIADLRSLVPEVDYLPTKTLMTPSVIQSEALFHFTCQLCEDWMQQSGLKIHYSGIISLSALLKRHLLQQNHELDILFFTSRFTLSNYTYNHLAICFLGKANIRQVYQVDQLIGPNSPKPDLIITDTLNLSGLDDDIEIIVINPFITEKELQVLSEIIDEKRQNKQDAILTRKILELKQDACVAQEQ